MVDSMTESTFTDKEIEKIRAKTKELLSTKKIDRKFLAQELQRNRSNVNRFLNGKQKLNAEALKRLRKILSPDEKWIYVCPVGSGGGKIIDFLIKSETSPFELEKDKIKNILLNQRKLTQKVVIENELKASAIQSKKVIIN
jgi:plasmid maintenance system antidote protein VapI